MPRTKKNSSKNKDSAATKSRKSRPAKIKTLKGFKDIRPENQKYWDFVYDKVKNIAADYSYKKIETPIVEDIALFERTVGETSDIVSKEMFAFKDKGGKMVVLRPEITASVVRAYIEHGMLSLPQPVKLWYWGPVFRYDKPQAGRYRQFHQFGYEVIGNGSAETDSQLIIMAYNLFKSFGLEVITQINSIGCKTCRKKYIKDLTKFLADKKLCKDCKNRLEENPLRILDCKQKKCQEQVKEAPQIIDSLCEECKNHFVKVLEGLDEAGIPYNLDPFLVRGLDYYSRTTFEIYPAEDKQKSQNALAGGGRYDYLVEELGGRPTPATGFAPGIERIILKLKEANIEISDSQQGDVFVAQLGTDAKKKAKKLFNTLRKENIKVREAFSKKGLAEQMEIANNLNVKYALILGQKEIMDDTIIIRNMNTGIQEIVDFEKVIPEIKKRILENGGVKVYTTEDKKENEK